MQRLLIVGAGCSGLSLAVNLCQGGLGDRRLVICDPRTTFGADRTWCFWNVSRHPFEDAVTHRWPRWWVRGHGAGVTRSSARWAYHHLPGEGFYAQALARLRADERVELRLGVEVAELRDDGGQVVASTSDGEISAAAAFDSRPARLGSPGEVLLWQHFRGHRIRTAEPVFDSETVTLMDFAVDQSRGIHFLYVLPFSATEALVESTFLSPSLQEPQVYDDAIAQYLHARWALSEWEVLGLEEGAIPMTTEPLPSRPSRRIYRLGLAGGLGKPSTGYAFLAIQRFSAELARRLGQRDLPEPPRVRSPRSAFLDTVFLSFLCRHPKQAPGVFADLFAKVEPDALIRFLSDVGSPADDLRVMRAAPALPLMAEALRSRRLWLR